MTIPQQSPALAKRKHYIQWNIITKFEKLNWTIIHRNHLSAAHIPGKLNIVADNET